MTEAVRDAVLAKHRAPKPHTASGRKRGELIDDLGWWVPKAADRNEGCPLCGELVVNDEDAAWLGMISERHTHDWATLCGHRACRDRSLLLGAFSG